MDKPDGRSTSRRTSFNEILEKKKSRGARRGATPKSGHSARVVTAFTRRVSGFTRAAKYVKFAQDTFEYVASMTAGEFATKPG